MRKMLLAAWLCFLSASVLGLGITPASKQLDFQPGAEKTIVYRLYNTEAKDFTASINVSGSLKQYISLDQQEIVFTKDDKVKTFTLTVKFPEQIPPEANAQINVLGLTKDASATLNLAANIGVIMPTGSFVVEPPKEEGEEAGSAEQQPEGKSPLLMIAIGLLVLIAIGNIVFFTYNRRLGTGAVEKLAQDAAPEPEPPVPVKQASLKLCFSDGTPVRTLAEMLYFVQNVPDNTFRSYVNQERNDIAMWTDVMLKEPRLALRIFDTTDRQDMINAFSAYLQSRQHEEEQKQAAVALREEIERLKQDLDVM